jgi:hypothetical protein
MPRGLLVKERALEPGLAFRAAVQVFGLPVILSARSVRAGRQHGGDPLPDRIDRPVISRPLEPRQPTPPQSGPQGPARCAEQNRANRRQSPSPTVLLVIAARIGRTASCGVILSDAAKDATEIAAACVSTKPATTAPTVTPASPSQGRENQHDRHHRGETEGRPDAESTSGLGVGCPLRCDGAQSKGETIERRGECANPQCGRHQDEG